MIGLFLGAALAGPPTDLPLVPDAVSGRDRPAPIVNGSVEDAFPAAVGIGAGGFTLCSASLITPRILLTAAHCSADMPVELVVAFGQAYFGTEASSPDHALGLANAVVHPDYKPLTGGGQFLGEYDIAVLELAEDAPVDPVWPRLDPLDEDEALGARVWSVGYGLDENGASGTKRSARLRVDEMDEMFLIALNSSNNRDANICSGDSGGPQYRELDDGTWEQWAVHSWGDEGCVFNSGSTRTDVAADWILEQIEAVHGTTDRCAIERRYQDGVCDEGCEAADPDCWEPELVGSAAAGGGNGGGESAGGCATAPVPMQGAGWIASHLLARRR